MWLYGFLIVCRLETVVSMKKAMRFSLLLGLMAPVPALAADPACTTCHAGYSSGEVHAAAGTTCEACHGPGDEHVTNPTTGVIRFGEGPTAERVAACSGCHVDVHAAGRSSHEQAGLACDDCHTVHGNEAQTRTGHALPAGFRQALSLVRYRGDTAAVDARTTAAREPADLGKSLHSPDSDGPVERDAIPAPTHNENADVSRTGGSTGR